MNQNEHRNEQRDNVCYGFVRRVDIKIWIKCSRNHIKNALSGGEL